jgi:hypothetical protein
MVHRTVLCLVCLCLLCVTAAGCGSGSHAASRASASTNEAASGATPRKAKVPPYRVGQYCVGSHDGVYRAHGLTCRQNHLQKR